MDSDSDDLIARILAENDKINQVNTTLSAVRKDLTVGDDQLHIARDKLTSDEYSDAFLHSTVAVEHYSLAISSAQQITETVDSSQDINELIEVASDLLFTGKANLMRAKEAQFILGDLKGLQSDVEEEVAAENWILVGLYARDAVNCYPETKWFNGYIELAKNKINSQKTQKTPWLNLLFRRES